MIEESKLSSDSLIWSQGFEGWTEIKNSDEFSKFLLPPELPNVIPPPLPVSETSFDYNYFIKQFRSGVVKNRKSIIVAGLAVIVIFALFNISRFFTNGTEPVLPVQNSEITPVVSEQELTGLSNGDRSKLILESLRFNILNQPTGGEADVELINESDEYSFEFDKVFLQTAERSYIIFQSKPKLNISVSMKKIEPRGRIKFTLPVADEYSITGWSLLYGENYTTIYRVSE